MNNKLLVMLFLGIFLISFTSADESFIFKQGENFTLELAMSNYDLSECLGCSCKVSLFYPNGSAMIRNTPGTVIDGFCQYTTSSRIIGIHGGDVYATNGIDNGRASFEFEITEYGTSASQFMLYALFYMALLIISFVLVYKFGTYDGKGIKDENFFYWAGFLDLVLFVLIEINGFGGTETLLVDLIKYLTFGSGLYFLAMGMIYSISNWKKKPSY